MLFLIERKETKAIEKIKNNYGIYEFWESWEKLKVPSVPIIYCWKSFLSKKEAQKYCSDNSLNNEEIEITFKIINETNFQKDKQIDIWFENL